MYLFSCKTPALICFLLLATVLTCVVSIETVVVSPTIAQGSLTHAYAPSTSYSFSNDVLEVANTCQLNFSYVSDQPVSVWLSLDSQAQTLQLLPNGRPCVNQTVCRANTYLNPSKRYYVLTENFAQDTATIILNYSASASSESGAVCPLSYPHGSAVLRGAPAAGCQHSKLQIFQQICILTAGCGVPAPRSVAQVSSPNVPVAITHTCLSLSNHNCL